MRKPKPPTERTETVRLAEYLSLLEKAGKISVFTKTAQETWTKSWAQKRKNTTEGVRPGLPDFFIVFPARAKKEGRLLVIELKRVRGGAVSKAQQAWIDAINTVLGAEAVVCRGFDEAKAVIDTYL